MLYKEKNKPIFERVSDLLSKMTLDEKIAQLMGVWDGVPERFDNIFLNDEEKMKKTFGVGVHSVHPYFADLKETVEQRNAIQKYLLEKTRLGIPSLFVDEGQHGMMRPEATCFPQAIGMACCWNPELIENVYSVVAQEMRSRGTHFALTPVVDVCRDPRWGRVEETYGEDPFLNSIYAIAAVKGLQGSDDGSVGAKNVAATLKHFLGHGQSEGGINQGPANYSLRVLYDYHMRPFTEAIKNAKPIAVMPSYNEVDGVPSHANKWLLKDILRKKLHFEGMIVSDYFAIDQLYNKHFVVLDNKEAAFKAFDCGVEYEFPVANFYFLLKELINEGKINEKDIDKAVEKVLALKFKLGLFENPFVDLNAAIKISQKEESRKLANEVAKNSIVLLKNNGTLPLQLEKYKKIAVIGPCAKDVYFGGYAGEPYYKVSLLDGIKDKVNGKAEVLFAQGCKLTTNTTISFWNWKLDEIVFASRDENLKLIEEAKKIASEADVVILAVGENDHLCREAWAKTHIGDNMTLDLFGEQQELCEAIINTGKPVIVYLMNGRPLSINYLNKHADAILEGWYMGQETGNAAADIIFGDVNPSGKLTITFPKHVGQLPMYYNCKPSAQFHDYISMDIKPLYPFGYGLSYTTFEISEPKLEKDTIKINETARVSVTIKNTGNREGAEVVQLYIRDKVSSVTRPVKELRGFKKVFLKPGESKTVTFELTSNELAYHDINLEYTVEPGEFEIMVGNCSADDNLKKITLVVIE